MNIENIIRLTQLRGMGRKTSFKVLETLTFKPSKEELVDFILDFSNENKFTRLPIYSKDDVQLAFDKAEQIMDKSEKNNVKIISYYDNNYPKSLKEIPDPPLILNLKGDISILNEMTGIAIIGTRQPTGAGVKAGKYFASLLGKRGYNIVSGLAIGCDASAHIGCLEAKGKTTAILAHGFQTIYPKENKELATQIVDEGGVLLSEYLIGTGALPNYFIERDRLQSGLSNATIVIQTAEKGGTMHAVNATIKSGKKLAAVKYNSPELINDKTQGNESLIRAGKAFSLTSLNIEEFLASVPLINNDHENHEKLPTSNLDDYQYKIF
ncbi:DNA-processing protein DprA [Pedobacter changchengzhani]|uniref:DNA-processing protein DprA n=1 Tax=Pedobacter changchengzhani TaxID=2529274 RepID=A0A4R5MKQ5_9SPHI|nr:DNA-processing protein DprA [Pedobacter changchengzhani]TDG35775.1 DNA-processing protein DprA [Pedobacter changchengzhani]